MRLSITLDPDLHRITASRARARGRSISREINDLLRQAVVDAGAAFPATPPANGATDPAIHHPDKTTGLLISAGRRRFPVSPGRKPLTDEDIRRMEDDEDLRHWKP